MKELLKWLGWVLLFIVLFFRGCIISDISKMETTEIKKTFKNIKPKHSEIPNFTNKKDLTNFVKSKPDNKYLNELENKIFDIQKQNDSLLANYKNIHDTIRIKEYEKAIQLKIFQKNFEDKFTKIELNGIVKGEVNFLELSYTLKPQPIPTTKFRLLAGLNISNRLLLDKPLFNINLGFQNKKGNILEIGYDTEKRINISLKKSIFKITK